MSDLVERVGQAILDAWGGRPFVSGDELARAAIAAMRDDPPRNAAYDAEVWSDGPGTEITLRGLCEGYRCTPDQTEPNPKNVAERVWRAMIDAALVTEKPE